MPTIGEFFDELKGVNNYSGWWALRLIETTTSAENWKTSQAQELTFGSAKVLFDSVKTRLEELRGYNESVAGLAQAEDEASSFLKQFGALVTSYDIELPTSDS